MEPDSNDESKKLQSTDRYLSQRRKSDISALRTECHNYILKNGSKNDEPIQKTIQNQITKKSKVSTKKEKGFVNATSRSHSQPRVIEEHANFDAPQKKSITIRCSSSPGQRGLLQKPKDIEDKNRLEENIRRFEKDMNVMRKYEFEQGRSEFKLPHKVLYNYQERRLLHHNCRKLSKDVERIADGKKQRFMTDCSFKDFGKSSDKCSLSKYEEGNSSHIHHQPGQYLNTASLNCSGLTSMKIKPEIPMRQRKIPRKDLLSQRSSETEKRIENLQKYEDFAADRSIKHSSALTDESFQIDNHDMMQEIDADIPCAFLPNCDLKQRRSVQLHQSKELLIKTKGSITPKGNRSDPVLIDRTCVSERYFMQRIFKKVELLLKKSQSLATFIKVLPSTLKTKLKKKKMLDFITYASFQWFQLKADYSEELAVLRIGFHKCAVHLFMLTLLCGLGGLLFRYIEGTSENAYKCEVRKVKRDFIEDLWKVSQSLREDDWKSLARQKLRTFEEELYALQELSMQSFSGQKSWNFVNCIIYCWTVITTIGYGHITPKTTLGQTLTIIYAIIGVPIFLILLTDFGKLFTRGMKFLWAYVRRLIYTGTCRKIRKQQQIRDAISGFETAYDLAVRRPSQFFGITAAREIDSESQVNGSDIGNKSACHPESPTSPELETYEIDDEFNLPVSVASVLLILYIIVGAFVYTLWEDWTYFEAFYFVFISMSTIGFGDFVPNHPIFMMCSILYLVFGLALTSMFINVVQIKLSDTFKHASAKISTTIGFNLAGETEEESGSQALKTPSETASVQRSPQLPLHSPVSILKRNAQIP